MRTQIQNSRRLVIKVGSALVTDDGAGLSGEFIATLAQQMAELKAGGRELLLVTSGAIAAGMQRLGWAIRPHSIHNLQAAAAVGQMGLATAYESAFAAHGVNTAQILLTHDDLADRTRYLNARSTLSALINLNVVPIINENDTVVTDEIKFGDNDTLGALVANLIEADALIILTDQQGLYSADPRSDPDATLISEGRADDRQYETMAGGAGSGISRGGMITKIYAAQRAARSGAHTVIASGRSENILPRLLAGEKIGTLLFASSTPLAARKQWLADHLQLTGSLQLDDGAVKALQSNRSLLPVGVRQVSGEFERGAVVACRNAEGREIARGLVNYSAAEAKKIAGRASQEIEAILGYVDEDVLIHKDNLVLL